MSSATVFMGNLPNEARDNDIENFFRGYGKIIDIQRKEGYAIVVLSHPRDADEAISDLNGKTLFKNPITIEKTYGSKKRDRFESRRPAHRNERKRVVRTSHRVFIRNLSSRVSWQDLKDYMSTVSQPTFADAHKKFKNEGMVEFSTYEDMKRAITQLDGTELKGRIIRMEPDERIRDNRRFSPAANLFSNKRKRYTSPVASRRGYARDLRPSRRFRSKDRSFRGYGKRPHSRSLQNSPSYRRPRFVERQTLRSRSRSSKQSRSRSRSRSETRASRSRSRSNSPSFRRLKLPSSSRSRSRSNSPSFQSPKSPSSKRSRSRSRSHTRPRSVKPQAFRRPRLPSRSRSETRASRSRSRSNSPSFRRPKSPSSKRSRSRSRSHTRPRSVKPQAFRRPRLPSRSRSETRVSRSRSRSNSPSFRRPKLPSSSRSRSRSNSPSFQSPKSPSSKRSRSRSRSHSRPRSVKPQAFRRPRLPSRSRSETRASRSRSRSNSPSFQSPKSPSIKRSRSRSRSHSRPRSVKPQASSCQSNSTSEPEPKRVKYEFE